MTKGDLLIFGLISDPDKFYKNGSSYQLLQEYFSGYPIATLVPLLQSDNATIRRQGVWIASELGANASPLLASALALAGDKDDYVKSYALEIITVCSTGVNSRHLSKVIEALDDENAVIRSHAMFLISNVDPSPMATALASVRGRLSRSGEKRQNLDDLLSKFTNPNQVSQENVEKMLVDKVRFNRQFGAIFSKKLREKFPELIQLAATLADEDISKFAQRAIRLAQ